MTLELIKIATNKSVLNKPEEEEVLVPEYTDEEREYLKRLQQRLETAASQRDRTHPEFDNLDYLTYWWACENLANTTLQPQKEKGEPDFRSGVIRTKLMAFLSAFQSLNLGADIVALDKRDLPIQSLGDAMEDVLYKTKELDNDEELQMLRQYELLKHGYVFVEEVWEEKMEIRKKIEEGFFGQKRGVKWKTEKVKPMGRPRRTIIPGPAVYLGDLNKYLIEDQPYIFTVEIKSYDDTEKIYGDWEMWKYVSKKLRSFSGEKGEKMIHNAWRLTKEVKEGQCEIIKYQDKPNNEYQIIINGVPMLPMGYPFPWGHGEYSIVQQNLEPIRANFAYGKSFVFKNKNIVAILDTMMKLMVLKSYKSLIPPLLNLSDRIISKKVLMPGQITRGIPKGSLVPVTEYTDQGVNNSEFNMVELVKRYVDENTVSPTFTGTKEAGGKVTATQILELQRQARMMMALFLLAASLLEKKLDMKRLMILLEKWFDPVDQVLDESRNQLINLYRVVSREKIIEGKGKGVRMVVPIEPLPSKEELAQTEERLRKEIGMPVKIIAIDPESLKRAKITWTIITKPKEKKTSEYSKILFGAMVQDALALGLRLKPEWVEEKFAEVWEEDPSKIFERGAPTMPSEEAFLPPKTVAEALKTPTPTPAGIKVSPEVKAPAGEPIPPKLAE